MSVLSSLKSFFLSSCHEPPMSSWTLVPKVEASVLKDGSDLNYGIEKFTNPINAHFVQALPFTKELQMSYLVLLSTLISSIKQVELLMPASTGKDKFDATIIIVEGVVGEVQSILPAIAPIVENLVAAFNKTGLFVKKPA